MHVSVRVRAPDAGHSSCCDVHDNLHVSITKRGANGSYLKSQAGAVTTYGYDSVFDEKASQRDVYLQTTAKSVDDLMTKGLNLTVFAYGATSAGKTHTMFGNTRQDGAHATADAGLIPNAVADVFAHIAKRSEGNEVWDVMVSFVEVYNESILDLLNPDTSSSSSSSSSSGGSSGNNKGLSLREDQEKGIVVIAGVTEQRVSTVEAVMDLLVYGNQNRKTESTNANQTSSRSHALLQLTISRTSRAPGSNKEVTTEAKLNLIDLAGSERASATSNSGARLAEGANINKVSLLALANCINALADNHSTGKKNNVKFRDSKLTLLLKNSLEGKSNLVMICCVNPSHLTYEDTHNTLKYANRAKNIKVNPVALETSRECGWVEREQRLVEENTRLRARVQELERLVSSLRAAAGAATTVDAAGVEPVPVSAVAVEEAEGAGDMMAVVAEAEAVEEPAASASSAAVSEGAEAAPGGSGRRRASLKRPLVDDAEDETAGAQARGNTVPPGLATQADDAAHELAPRDLKALKRRRQSAIPTFSARGGGRASILPSEPLFQLPEEPEESEAPPAAAAVVEHAQEPEPEPEFDLGAALSDNALPPPPPTRSSRRQSAAVGSKLASNRRKSMAAINTMLDTLSAIGLAAAPAADDGAPAVAPGDAGDVHADVGRVTRRKSMLLRRASVGGLGMEAWAEM